MRRRRRDYAGADWHIWNRGLGKRAVFETRQDVARFEDALGEVVDADPPGRPRLSDLLASTPAREV